MRITETDYYKDYNGKPFDLQSYSCMNEYSYEFDEYILSLNEYLVRKKLYKEGSSDLKEKFNLEIKNFLKEQDRIIGREDIISIISEVLIFCGVYVSFEFLDKIKIYKAFEKLLARQKILTNKLKKIESIINDDPKEGKIFIKKIQEWNKEKELIDLLIQQIKISNSNKGKSIVISLRAIILIEVMQEILKLKRNREIKELERTTIINLLGEIFVLFNIIKENDKISFPTNFNRTLYRLDQLKADNLKDIAAKIIRMIC